MIRIFRNKSRVKKIAIFLAVTILSQIVFPTVTWALTSGPNSPEFSSFEPVATTDMVDVFSGGFTYNLPVVNIPGPDGAGYSLSLSYHSGVSAEEEASWVGYGWTLNPGAINRNKVNYPDDYNGANVVQYNKSRPNWTASSVVDASLEFYSVDLPKGQPKGRKDKSYSPGINLSINKSVRFNNYRGFSKTLGFGLSVKGMVSLNMSRRGGENTYDASINPAAIISYIRKDRKDKENPNYEIDYSKKNKVQGKNTIKQATKKILGASASKAKSAALRGGSTYLSAHTYISGSQPVSVAEYKGVSYNYSSSLQLNFFGPVGVEVGYSGSFNIQGNEKTKSLPAYGYMNNPNSSGSILSDYTMEKSSDYDTRDNYLGIPFNSADNFMVTGEGLSGGFRLFHNKIGHFFPNKVTSEQKIKQMGVEFGVGASLQIGFDFGVGSQSLEMSDWGGANSNYPDTSFFRFNNDMGGSISYTGSEEPASASISGGGIPGFKGYSAIPEVISNLKTSDCGRSSFIEKHLVSQMGSVGNRFDKSASTSSLLNYSAPGSAIGEFAISNEDGNKYIYGLPSYSRDEKSINVGINGSVENNYQAFQTVFVNGDILKNETVVGEATPEAYAVNHLLTQINTPDYVDVGQDGPDEKDFGGWTKFGYRKWSAAGNEWFRFRTPYNGVLYNKNSLSNKRDDVGSVSSGEKQVYYLKTIETKTHIAFFVTNKTVASDFTDYNNGITIPELNGSGTSRADGFGAIRETSSTDPAATGKGIKDDVQRPEKLERILIYSKDRFDKPLQVVHFEYDNHLCKSLPNAESAYEQSGKLTLKRVWFESEGISKSKISPYEFNYEYFNNYPSEVSDRYPEIFDFANSFNDVAQNPDYKPYALDMWGNHQFNGVERKKNLNPWVYQGPTDDTFDPAAWNLKRIKLPSGGEIHIQYEQNDYSYVQDKDVAAMVSLKSATDSYTQGSTRYVLNLKDIGLDPSDPKNTTKITDLKNKLYNFLIPGATNYERVPERVYFKFLYALTGAAKSDLNNCRSEYIDGYTTVNDVGIDGSGNIYLSLGDGSSWKNHYDEEVYKPDPDRTNIPRQVCYDYVINNADGLLNGNDCDPDFSGYNGFESTIATTGNFESQSFRNDVAKPAIIQATKHVFDRTPEKEEVCKSINNELSYIKIPIYQTKKGGGIRVKRLLMYDNGIESGSANVFGTEYKYELENGQSSGVAENEPAAGREENALVNILDRQNQKWLSKIIAGADKKQSEGPLGESMLPAPSVGYSRVVIKNIHSGKTGTGFEVHEFYTCKDFPFVEKHTTLSGDNKKSDWMNVPAGLFNFKVEKNWLTQGYSFIINSLHGKPRKISKYSGDYTTDLANVSPISYTQYEYYKPGEQVKLLKYDPITHKFSYETSLPGKEEDVAMEKRSVRDESMDLSLELDIAINLTMGFPPPITFSFMPSFTYNESELSTHVTSKVLRYPTLVKSVTTYMDGGISKMENLAFNPDNGQPVVTRTGDSFDGLNLEKRKHDGGVFDWKIPASWIYPDLGQKSKNPDNFNQLNIEAGHLTSYGSSGDWLAHKFNANNIWDVSADSPTGVLTAEASQFKNDWFTSSDEQELARQFSPMASATDFAQLNKIWKMQGSYVYKTDVNSSNPASLADTNRIYNGGIFNSFNMFDWTDTLGNQNNWLLMNEVVRYSPNGNGLEERNILGIYSAAKYGYRNNILPIIVAQNSRYESVFFNDFENDQINANGITSHSGKRSIDLKTKSNVELVSIKDGIKLTDQLKTKGAYVKVWLKNFKPLDNSFENTTSNFKVKVNDQLEVPFFKVSGSGEWSLYQAKIEDWGTLSTGSNLYMKLMYSFGSGEQVYIDDFRFQPVDAQVMCSVYDIKSLRLITQFDDQHFGVYYQYDDEGKLVRKMIETEKGMKTIKETHYNVPKI